MRSPRELALVSLRTLHLVHGAAASAMYREQAARSPDRKTAAVLRQLGAHEATHACEARLRLRTTPWLRLAEQAASVAGSLVGRASATVGTAPALLVGIAVERAGEAAYETAASLLDQQRHAPERRVLLRARDEDREHRALLRERLGL